MSNGSAPNYESSLETLSDEDFLNQAEGFSGETLATTSAEVPASIENEAAEAVEDQGQGEDQIGVEDTAEDAVEDDGDPDEPLIDRSGPGGTLEAQLDAAPAAKASPAAGDHTTPKQTPEQAAAEAAAGAAPAEGETKPEAPTDPAAAAKAAPVSAELPNYEDLYKQIMAPFKANGREFAPTSPEEAVRLMQMGANYTKKMQALKPSLKLLRMLENNDLLQEDEVAHLIDLKKGDPKAIQKLLHDKKVDPLEVDASATPDYTPGNHSISDADMAFHDALDTVTQTPTGKETIKVINEDWDQVSKKAIFQEPHLLQIIDVQRSNGIYAKITAEIDRRRILGDLANVPFIHAYKTVGDELHSQGRLLPEGGSAQAAPVAAQPTPTPPAQIPVASTRSNRSRSQAATREQVRAVSSAPGSAPKVATRTFDPLNMTDEEIMAMPSPF